MSVDFELYGQRLVIRADRSAFWTNEKTLMVADLHFGKADTFRAYGVPVPGGTDETLGRLTSAIEDTKAERLVVLGDFWHARPGRILELIERLARWKSDHATLVAEVVLGNHDRAGPPPPGWGDWHAELIDPPFVFTHFPNPSAAGYTLAGHLHPGVLLHGRGRQRLKLPCFRFGDRVGVLPAFGDFTGLAAEIPRPHERVFAVAGGSVVEVSVD